MKKFAEVSLQVIFFIAISGAVFYLFYDKFAEEQRNKTWIESIGPLLTEISQTAPHIMSSGKLENDPFQDGGWLVINENDWRAAQESELIKEELRARDTSDTSYVLVVSSARKSVGIWGYQGNTYSKEMFVSEYLFHLKKKVLLSREILRSAINPNGTDIAFTAWDEDQNEIRPTIRRWLAHRGIVDFKRFSNWYPLEDAAREGNVRLVEYLLKKGHSPNDHDWKNNPPIHNALENGHATVAKVLLDNGAKQDILTYSGLGYIELLR